MMEPDDPRLDNYILDLARGRDSRVCYVPTATGDNDFLVTNSIDCSAPAVAHLICRCSSMM